MGNWGAISPIIGGVDVSNILGPPWIKMENRLVFGFIGNWFDSYMSCGRNYLFGEYAFTKCGGSPIGYQGFGCSGHQHQNRSMRFTVWDDLICYMIENCRRASQDARVPFDSKCRYNYKIFQCALVHLGYTYYRHLWKHEKEDSTFFGSQQGQQTMNFELWSKPFLPQSGMQEFVQHEGMVVTLFHPSWSWSIKLVQFHTGMVWPGIKMIQTEYRIVSVGVSVGPA